VNKMQKCKIERQETVFEMQMAGEKYEGEIIIQFFQMFKIQAWKNEKYEGSTIISKR
jgi:hypothetical protein